MAPMGFSTSDTIVAIATPPGRGGIGIVRLSGSRARRVVEALLTRRRELEPRRATVTRIRASRPARTLDGAGASRPCDSLFAETLDDVVVTFFPGPRSYTGEDVVEIGAHGSPVVLRAIVTAAMAAGARLAEPGEFTLRAFLNGRIDLPQAEAVADLIDAVTPLQARAAFDQLQGTLTAAIARLDAVLFDLIARLEASIDFPDEGYHFIEPSAIAAEIDRLTEQTAALVAEGGRGRLVRDGFQVTIAGRPNVGKSSLFNALAGAARAIVSETAGTTRDLVSETVDIGGLRVTLVDTAGLDEARDGVEAEGMARAKRAVAVSDLTLIVLDRSSRIEQPDRDIIRQITDIKGLDCIIVANKCDQPEAWNGAEIASAVPVSALTGAGMDDLSRRIAAVLEVDRLADPPAITNVRHTALVRDAHQSLLRARDAALAEGGALPEEFVLADLQQARAALEHVTGRRTSDDVLTHIFSRFCVGK
jgi:tRNA modification GTPase